MSKDALTARCQPVEVRHLNEQERNTMKAYLKQLVRSDEGAFLCGVILPTLVLMAVLFSALS